MERESFDYNVHNIAFSGYVQRIPFHGQEMYSGLLSAVVKLENDVPVLSVAVQNGFFWQRIIDKLREEKTKLILVNNLTRLNYLYKDLETAKPSETIV